MPKPRSLRLSLILLSLLLTGVIALAAAIFFRHDALRWYYLQKLRSTDSEVRLRGMAYVCRHAASDPAVRLTMQSWLADPAADDQLRADIIRSLRCADAWGPSFGPPWLAWLDHILADTQNPPAPGVRIGITFQLIRAAFDHQPVIADPTAAALLRILVRDEDPDVRYWAVRAAAALPEKSRALVLDIALQDAEPVIARHARIIDALSRDQRPDPPDPSYPRMRTASLQHLGEYFRNLSTDSSPSADAEAALAASILAPHLGSDPAADVLKPVTWSGRDGYKLRELATLENLPPRSLDITPSDDWPPLVRLAAARAAKNLDDDTLFNLFESDDSSVRLLACFFVRDRLTSEQLIKLIDRLNHTFYENKRVAGAMLIALTGLQPATLDERFRREHVWLVQQHLLLAKWMLDQPQPAPGLQPAPGAPGFNIDNLLINSAFPRDALYLALLQRGRIDALDLIFQPFTPDAGQLRTLLAHQRFYPILQRYLAADQPAFDLYADPQTQLFQCDVLRDWYLMHRPRLHFDPARRQFAIQP